MPIWVAVVARANDNEALVRDEGLPHAPSSWTTWHQSAYPGVGVLNLRWVRGGATSRGASFSSSGCHGNPHRMSSSPNGLGRNGCGRSTPRGPHSPSAHSPARRSNRAQSGEEPHLPPGRPMPQAGKPDGVWSPARSRGVVPPRPLVPTSNPHGPDKASWLWAEWETGGGERAAPVPRVLWGL